MNTSMKQGCFFLLVLLISAPGCWGGKKQRVETKPKDSTEVFSEINIPVAGDSVKSFFDEDIEEFAVIDNPEAAVETVAQDQKIEVSDDFSWVEEANADEFKTVYFGFDRYEVGRDQENAIERDIELVKNLIAQGEIPTVVIEGHSCHSAGSKTYNLALSEKRAKVLADRLVAAGVARENIKVVARGSEVPVRDKAGSVVTGDKDQQWQNRRDEIHVIYS